jgi:hypothetical protein
MRNSNDIVMDPTPPAVYDCIANALQPDTAIMIAAHRQDGRELAETGNQVAQLAELRRSIHEIAAQEQNVRAARARRLEHLPAKKLGARRPQMDIADIHEPAGILARGEALLADVQRPVEPERQ